MSNAYTMAFVLNFAMKLASLFSLLVTDAHLLHTRCLTERRKITRLALFIERDLSVQICYGKRDTHADSKRDPARAFLVTAKGIWQPA
jgi:hypothetical protein